MYFVCVLRDQMGLDLDTERNSILYPDPTSEPVISGSTILLKTALFFFVFNLNNLEHISLLFILILPSVQNSHDNLLTATN
jgi:hypothetical protein